MISESFGGIRGLRFSSFPDLVLDHAIFSRHGGISAHPYQSLNLGGTSGDSRENVIENRKRIFDFLNRPVETVFDVWQVHGNDVINTERARPAGEKHQPADGIVTNCRDVTLLMRFADCVPILFFDPVQKAIGLAHAGWQGTIKRVTQKTIQLMQKEFGSNAVDIIAGIGPSIGKDHYEVGKNVVDQVRENLSEMSKDVIHVQNGKTYFDLWQANRLLLEQMGVNKIEIAGICTACKVDDWYSYRVEGRISGRFGVLIGLK